MKAEEIKETEAESEASSKAAPESDTAEVKAEGDASNTAEVKTEASEPEGKPAESVSDAAGVKTEASEPEGKPAESASDIADEKKDASTPEDKASEGVSKSEKKSAEPENGSASKSAEVAEKSADAASKAVEAAAEDEKSADAAGKTVAETEKSAEAASQPAKKRRGKIAWIVAAVVLAAVYAGPAWFYSGHFYPGTVIDKAQVGNMDLASAAEVMDAQIDDFEMKILGRTLQDDTVVEELESVKASDIALRKVDSLEVAERILGDQNALLWFTRIMQQEEHDDKAKLSYDEDALEKLAASWDVFCEENTKLPVDAHISEYNDAVKGFEIVLPTAGNRPDAARAMELIKQAVYAGEAKVDLDEAGCYPKARIREDDKTLNWNLETANRWMSTEITYDWNGSEVVVDAKVLKNWIDVKNSRAHLDEDAVKQFVTDRAAENDTYGRDRVIHTSLGKDITVSGKRYGWRTDRSEETKELISLIHDGKKEKREPIYLNVAAVKGKEDDIGNSYVEIDLGGQHLYLYVDGKMVLDTDFVSGNMSNGNATPPGIFGLTYKTTDAILRGADYATPVKYWMPFNGNVGMHDATWRRAFGGDIYLTSGSHGCVNLPLSAAKQIYSYVSKGFPVICYY